MILDLQAGIVSTLITQRTPRIPVGQRRIWKQVDLARGASTMEQQLFSVREAGAILGYGKTKTHELINRGLLGAVLVDDILRVTAEGIEEFLRNLEPANEQAVVRGADRRVTGEHDQRANRAQMSSTASLSRRRAQTREVTRE